MPALIERSGSRTGTRLPAHRKLSERPPVLIIVVSSAFIVSWFRQVYAYSNWVVAKAIYWHHSQRLKPWASISPRR